MNQLTHAGATGVGLWCDDWKHHDQYPITVHPVAKPPIVVIPRGYASRSTRTSVTRAWSWDCDREWWASERL